jgi:antitoxin HigA-1
MKKNNENLNALKEPRPRHPGDVLKAEYLDPLGITQQELADYLGITRVRINEVLLGKRAISTDTAIRLARFFNTSVHYWLGMQTELDLWDARNNNEEEYLKITPLKGGK